MYTKSESLEDSHSRLLCLDIIGIFPIDPLSKIRLIIRLSILHPLPINNPLVLIK